jgi:hypothetical protein
VYCAKCSMLQHNEIFKLHYLSCYFLKKDLWPCIVYQSWCFMHLLYYFFSSTFHLGMFALNKIAVTVCYYLSGNKIAKNACSLVQNGYKDVCQRVN